MDERKIAYFIMSHSVRSPDGKMRLLWPVPPSPAMGGKFLRKIAAQHAEIAEWMRLNPEMAEQAENGCYKVENK